MAKKGNIPTNKGVNRKTGVNYAEIRDIYVTGNFTLKQLAEQFGIGVNTLEVQSATNKWGKQKKEYTDRYKEDLRKKLKSNVIEEELKINQKHYSIWNKIYDIIDEVLDDKAIQLTYENGNYRLGQIETITNIMVQTQGGQRLSAGMIEASKLRELALNDKRLVIEQERENPKETINQDRTFIAALGNEMKSIWKDEKKPEEHNIIEQELFDGDGNKIATVSEDLTAAEDIQNELAKKYRDNSNADNTQNNTVVEQSNKIYTPKSNTQQESREDRILRENREEHSTTIDNKSTFTPKHNSTEKDTQTDSKVDRQEHSTTQRNKQSKEHSDRTKTKSNNGERE